MSWWMAFRRKLLGLLLLVWMRIAWGRRLAGRFILGGASGNSRCQVSRCMSGKLPVWLSCVITIWICIRTYSHSTYKAVRIVKVSIEKIGDQMTLKHVTVSPSGGLGRDSG